MNDILPEILSEMREMRTEITESRVLLERNTVTLEEHIRRTIAAENRIQIMEDHIMACPARSEHAATETLWKRIRNWGIVLAIVGTLLTQIIPWLRGK